MRCFYKAFKERDVSRETHSSSIARSKVKTPSRRKVMPGFIFCAFKGLEPAGKGFGETGVSPAFLLCGIQGQSPWKSFARFDVPEPAQALC